MDLPLFKEVALFVVIALTFFIGIFVLASAPRRMVNRAFFTTATGISLWGLGIMLLSETAMFEVFDKVTLYGFVILLLGYVTFAQVFPRAESVPKRFWLLFIPLGFIAGILPFDLVISDALVDAHKAITPVNGPLFPVFAAICVGYVFLGLVLFMRTYRKTTGLARQQMYYLLLGLGIFILCAITFDVVMPAFGIFQLNFLGPICSIVLTAFSAYAIIRHRLMDIRVVIQRGLIYTILLGIIICIYVAGLQLLGYFLHEVTKIGSIISAAATMILGIFFIRPLENYFRKVTDHIFFKDTYNYAEAMHALSGILYTSLSEKDIIDHTRAILEKIFKTDTVVFVLDPEAVSTISDADKETGFETLSHPIVFDDNAIGTLHLGKKRSGDIYTKQDLQLVSTFAFQAAISLGKAKLHDRVREYSTHLEELVEERTAKIQKLQEEQKEAMIDISHNLQTPLAIIRGELELLGKDQPEESDNMHAVRKSIDRVSGFIRQLLRIARLEHSLDKVDMERLDLSALLREQADYFEVMAEEKVAHITTKITDGIFVRGNKRLLDELFINIVANALIYRSPDRSPRVRITLDRKEGSSVATIGDNGAGINAEDLARIFDRFYRTSREANCPQGTGLGLAIAKEIVERHHGSIGVESLLGRGTTFTIVLPVI